MSNPSPTETYERLRRKLREMSLPVEVEEKS